MTTKRIRPPIRDEQAVFADLSTLCRSTGYAHAVAYFCFRDNIISYADDMTAEDILKFSSKTCLIRTEISILIGLMIQGEISYALPTPDTLQQYIERTEALLEEMHYALSEPLFASFTPENLADPGLNPFTGGDALREPIFYGGESAYGFQYRDFSLRKYTADNEWLQLNKGFSIQEARDVVQAIGRVLEQKLISTLEGMRHLHPTEWSILPGFTFRIWEVAEISGIANSTIEAVLNAFALSPDEKNQNFHAIHDFNAANAMPLLRTSDGGFLVFQVYSLVEALYESPFYWMGADQKYKNIAMRNRGKFTEEFCRERLELVFGMTHVHSNVDIFESTGKKAGEIDVLVLFGDRAIILQAKSKRLTLEARKGSDYQIKDDFKKSVQDSYDQALLCAKHLNDPKFKLVNANSRVIATPNKLKEIYVLCVVSDHYPALSFQARQFLSCETTHLIQPPLVLDVFALDAMTEMLQSPLYFLSYVNRRVNYTDRLIAQHELTILSYHLTHNLWLNDERTMLSLSDGISANLDVAMAVRRDDVNGKDTPDGILTRFKSTALGGIVKEIETKPHPGIIDLGFFLLTLSEKAVLDTSMGIDRIAQLAQKERKSHDLTVGFDSASAGLTIHCNEKTISAAEAQLKQHCELRKYKQRANRWFGICIRPGDRSIRFCLGLDYEWQPSSHMDLATRDMLSHSNLAESLRSVDHERKVGRNDPCPCGSMMKFKKCCLRK